MCDLYRTHAPCPSSSLPLNRECARSSHCISGSVDTASRLNTATLSQHHHSQSLRESRAAGPLVGRSRCSSTGQARVLPCGVSTPKEERLKQVNDLPQSVATSHWSSLSSTSLLLSPSTGLSDPPGTLASVPVKYGDTERAEHPAGRAVPASPPVAIAAGASAFLPVGPGAAPSRHGENTSTGTAAGRERSCLSDVVDGATRSHLNDASRKSSEPFPSVCLTSSQDTCPTASGVVASGELMIQERHRKPMALSVRGDVTTSCGRRGRSCPCPSVRRAAVTGGVTAAASPFRANTDVAARLGVAAAATHPDCIDRGDCSQSSTSDNVSMREVTSAPDLTVNPLRFWRTSSPLVAAVSTARLAPQLGAKKVIASSHDADLGCLLTLEVDSGVLVMDPCHTPGDLVCGVCMSLCRRPTATTCGHLFCRSCLQGWIQANPAALCPLDRTPIDLELLHTDVRAQRQINTLPCRCPASLSQVQQWGLLRLRSASRVVGGGAAVEGGDGDDVGTQKCEEKSHPRCTWAGCVSDALVHLSECPYIIVECPFAEHGCTVALPRADMMGHIKDCVEDHLLLLSQALVTSKDLCRVLQEEADVLRQRGRMVHYLDTPNGCTNISSGNLAPTVSNASLPLQAAVVPPAPLIAPGGAGAPGASAAMATFQGNTSMGARAPSRVVSPFGSKESAADTYSTEISSQRQWPPYRGHHRTTLTAPPSTMSLHTVADEMLFASQRMFRRYDSFMPVPMETIPLCFPSHLATAPRTSVPAAKITAGAPNFAAGAAGILPSTASSAPLHVSPEGGQAGGMDRFIWVITNVSSLKAPCYSRPFISHGFPWYVGIDTTSMYEQSGVYLFPKGHDHRINFRVILYHKDPARDVVHAVRDWQEAYIGKGWGPLRFINLFKLEKEGFVTRDCLRVGIEVLSDPY